MRIGRLTPSQKRLWAARRREVRALRTVLLSVVALLTVANVLFPWLWREHPFDVLMIGAVDGGTVVAACGLVNLRTYNLTVGTWAETWTSERLLKEKGWRVVDNVHLEYADLDHLVITPGGVLAVETKYYGPAAIGGDHSSRLDRDIKTTQRRAQAAAQLLAGPQIGHPCSVHPVLVVWGVGTPEHLPERQGGVWLVPGDHGADALVARFSRGSLDREWASSLERAVAAYQRASPAVAA